MMQKPSTIWGKMITSSGIKLAGAAFPIPWPLIVIAALPLFFVLFVILKRIRQYRSQQKYSAQAHQRFQAEKLKASIEHDSRRLAYIKRLNEYTAFSAISSHYTFTYKICSQLDYDAFDFDEYFERTLQRNLSKVSTLLRLSEENEAEWASYQDALLKAPSFLSDERPSSIELALCQTAILAKPRTEFSIVIEAEFTGNGTSHKRRRSYSMNFIRTAFRNIQKNEQSGIESKRAARQERAKVTPKLRYEVFKRDGFRCKFCGASSKDGANLHVDHIIPVSRGGKTELANLQTLCETCNLGKGVDTP